VLEPQGTGFFLLLLLVFTALLAWVVVAKQVVFRVLAACLAFLPAMTFGVAAVNKYYDYYQSWGALVNDLTGGSTQNIPKLSAASVGSGRNLGGQVATQGNGLAKELGFSFQVTVPGPVSHIKRDVLVWLPPQYFSSAYKSYRFPVIELLHGSPGSPTAWINVMSVLPTFLNLLNINQAQPAVLVMPDTDGGPKYGLQCLNYPGGLQDMTYVAREVPNYIAHTLRVQAPGRAWAIAGYSEGGYCAANIGLQYPNQFGFVGSLSGYFAPIQSQVPAGGRPGGKPVRVNPYVRNPQLLLRNTPQRYALHLPIGTEIPQYWLAAGSQDPGDVAVARFFREELLTWLADVPLDIVQGGGHQAKVWRAALTPMLQWMTPQLTQWAQRYDKLSAAAARHQPKPSGATLTPLVPGQTGSPLPGISASPRQPSRP
jgi:enterochelin esterase-like enzyme